MIHNTLRDIGAINAFRSDKALLALIEELNDSTSKRNNTYGESVKDAMRDFYPSRFRKDALDMVYNDVGKQPMEALDKLYEEYLKKERDGSYVYADIDKLERYSALINKLHPFTILGRRLAMELENGYCDLREIESMAEVVTPLLLGARRENRDYSDNHIHLGGANENLPNLLILFERETRKEYYEKEWNGKLPRLSEFSLINSGTLSMGHLVDLGKCAMHYIWLEIVRPEDREKRKLISTMQAVLKYGRVAAKMRGIPASFAFPLAYSCYPNDVEGKLLKKAECAAQREERIAQWFYYNILLHRLYRCRQYGSITQKMVMIVFQVVNIIRSYQIMSQNIGLSHFSEFFGSKVRQTRFDRHHAIAENIFRNGTTMLEGKISPGAIYDGEMMRYKLAFDREILRAECGNRRGYAKSFVDTMDPSVHRKYHFSIHFQRKDDNRKQKGVGCFTDVRHIELRKQLKEEAQRLHDYLYIRNTKASLRKHYRPFVQDLNALLCFGKALQARNIDPAKMIVSLDVAGQETLAPPEVFAPAINFLRAEPKRYGYYGFTLENPETVGPHRQLRLSVHAGEDFNHIATGIRRIDETITYYGMHSHDRLGHALAVGIDPAQWLERNGDVFMRKIDRLDDLVWLHKQVGMVLQYYPEAVGFLHRAEYLIEKLSTEIYGVGYSPQQLYSAWELRKYCPIESSETMRTKGNDLYFRKAVWPKGEENKDAIELFRRYHTDAKGRENGNKTLRLTYTGSKEAKTTEELDALELDVLRAVQDLMLQKIADKGIYIEANPSSNVYIAQLEHFAEHPVFRWDPVNGFDEKEQKKYNRYAIRKGRVRVCINTDDPSIFATTLFAEFKHLKRAAVDELGYHKPAVEQWLKAMRQFGNEIFEYDHQVFETFV